MKQVRMTTDEAETQTREQLILRAAEQEFLAKGYDGARTTSIAAAAGVTHAMLHYYFRTKEQLFERILEEKITLMASSMLAVLGDPELPLQERLVQGISRHFDFVTANPELPRFIINEVIAHLDRLPVMQQQVARITGLMFARLQQDIDAAALRGEMEPVDVRMLMLDIVSLNIAPFLIYPVVRHIFGEVAADRERFWAMRKAETIETITRRIHKNNTI